jgi:hypothetical protein
LTDFEEFAVYETRTRPQKEDKAGTGRVMYLTYKDYVDQWDEIASRFSYAAVVQGYFDRFAETSEKKRGTQEVDSEFLKEIESWRELLAKNIALRNPDVSIYELNYAVQKIIDRLIFLRICEDRGIEHYGQLQTKAEAGDVYMHLLNHFRLAESKYDSGIFDFDTDRITPALMIDDKVLKMIIQALYYPKSPYEFSVLGVEILGNVYEQFLGKVIRLTAGHQAKVETKPEVKKAGGVYYTPQYIVEYIVKNTVGKLIAGKTPEEISAIKILDPACGSGSFLIGAYTYLLRYHLDWYVNNKPKKHKAAVFQVKENEWYLTTAEKKRILLDNIFGVDIDSQAVEVTKLSLLLKVLEHESRESIDNQAKLGLEGVLPNLGDNIKCGNSLIGPEYYELEQQQTLFDEAEMRRVNVFDWDDERKGFGGIMRRGGFNAVIGNPPYVRIQTMKEWAPTEVEFYKRHYVAASKGNYDIYVVFVERALQLLNVTGRMGYILPHKFFQGKYGQPLRELIAKGKHLDEIVHFGDQQVFAGATTYTCLLFLEKEGGPCFRYVKAHDLDTWRASGEVVEGEVDAEKVTEKEWNFVVGSGAALFERLSEMPVRLGRVAAKIFQGLVTGADPVFIMENVSETEFKSAATGKIYPIEAELMHSLCKGSVNLRRYHISEITKLILFPYMLVNGKAELLSVQELGTRFPNTWAYLKENRQKLEAREGGKWKHDKWYAFGRSQNLSEMEQEKILTPSIANRTSFTLDTTDHYYFVGSGGGGGGGYGITLKGEYQSLTYFYILGLLNSKLLDWFLKQTSSPYRGGYYSYNRQYIENIPIYLIDFSNPAEKAQHDKLVALVDNMLELQKKYHETRMERDKELYERQIKVVDAQIDKLVYDLYGLTEEEIRIVEEE